MVECLGLLHIRTMTIDCPERRWIVDGQRVGCETNDRSKLGVQMQEVDVFVSTVCVVQVWQWSQACEKRPWMAAESMEVKAVNGCCQQANGDKAGDCECDIAHGECSDGKTHALEHGVEHVGCRHCAAQSTITVCDRIQNRGKGRDMHGATKGKLHLT